MVTLPAGVNRLKMRKEENLSDFIYKFGDKFKTTKFKMKYFLAIWIDNNEENCSIFSYLGDPKSTSDRADVKLAPAELGQGGSI